MSRFAPEPDFRHDQPARIGVLLINLGTPDAPTAPAVRRYLYQFLSDPRVVEIPPLLWRPLLHGLVLRTRPAQSAAKYATVWRPDGSPLKVYTERQAELLQAALDEALPGQLVVRYAMRYGEPAIGRVLADLKAAGCDRILLLPLYPQYAASTTATALDEAFAFCAKARNMPEVRAIKHFHDHPAYIHALAESVEEHWRVHGRPDKLLTSYHGIPRRSLDLGDPYHCECHKTSRLLAEALGLQAHQWQLTFQSRFGRAEWLQPYTAPTLEALGREGLARVDVICPGFVSDCLETLEEIAIEGRDLFIAAGGRELHAIPCLNDRPRWITALAAIAQDHLQGWLGEDAASRAAAAQATARRAHALGASA